MKSNNLKIGLIGLGMVGKPIYRWFQDVKNYRRNIDLFCYDTDPKKGYFDDVNKAEIIFVAVPTPPNLDGSCNVSIVEAAVKKINNGKIVVIKSTVPPGTVEGLQNKYPQKKLMFNPEFLTESQAWEDFIKPIRQIVGYTKKSKGDAMRVLNLLPQSYYPSPHATDYNQRGISATEAELIKYFSNVFGATKVTMANMFANVCLVLAEMGYDVNYENVREAIGADPRIGPAWLNINHGYYRGFGGYCFPKDLQAYIVFKSKFLKTKSKTLKKLLSDGLKILESIWSFNENLLAEQGLTVDEVSKHNKELILQKKKDIK